MAKVVGETSTEDVLIIFTYTGSMFTCFASKRTRAVHEQRNAQNKANCRRTSKIKQHSFRRHYIKQEAASLLPLANEVENIDREQVWVCRSTTPKSAPFREGSGPRLNDFIGHPESILQTTSPGKVIPAPPGEDDGLICATAAMRTVATITVSILEIRSLEM